ncbi:MAG: hypothetical protein M1828_001636 [Chrysothrix sp. TS-e1954]|nr:MAG: hypothetical protein M1828_001636 [Chrysothrix sp. TS-e1954]
MAASIKRAFKSFRPSPALPPSISTATITTLFPTTDPLIDGDACLHDCETCTIKLPKGFKIDEDEKLYGQVNGWSTHLIVGSGKSDWVKDVTDEKGSVMEAVGKYGEVENGKLMLSASNFSGTSYDAPTTVLLLPSFTLIDDVTPSSVPTLLSTIVSKALTNTTPLHAQPILPLAPTLPTRPCPHRYLILLCSQKTRDARCGQSAPLLRKEFERHLRPLGLQRDLHDERPGGVGIYFISHVGGHKFSANVMVYRRAEAAGVIRDDSMEQQNEETGVADLGAAQCIWLARVRPEDCENIVRYTVLQGKVVKPDRQLRGGFDRAKGLVSW